MKIHGLLAMFRLSLLLMIFGNTTLRYEMLYYGANEILKEEGGINPLFGLLVLFFVK